MNKKKVLIVGAVAVAGLGVLLAASSGTANAAPAEPIDDTDDDGPAPEPGELPPGQSTVDLDEITDRANDVLEGLPEVPRPAPAPPIVSPTPVSPPVTAPPPFVPTPQLPDFSTQPIEVPRPSAPAPRPAPAPAPVPLPVPLPAVPLPPVSPIPLPPPNVAQPAPAPAPMSQPTLEMLRILLAKESSPTQWKNLDEPSVRAWQRFRRLVVDGSFGPKGAAALAAETGLLPIVRGWPKGSLPNTALPAFRETIENIALTAEEPRRSHLLAAIDREQGQAFGTPPKPITTLIEGV